MSEISNITPQVYPQQQTSGSKAKAGAIIGAATGATIAGGSGVAIIDKEFLRPLSAEQYKKEILEPSENVLKKIQIPMPMIEKFNDETRKIAQKSYLGYLEICKNARKNIVKYAAVGALTCGAIGALIGSMISNKKENNQE